MKIEIKHRITGAVLYAGKHKKIKEAVLAASNANLGNADLSNANLSNADLGGASLGNANLRNADLRNASLGNADLGGADLRNASLDSADLRNADLRNADLGNADLGGASLGNASLGGASLVKTLGLPTGIPVIADIDKKILAAFTADGCALEMNGFHTCATTHCRCGWVIHLAGDAGRLLESIWGSDVAGSLIYTVSRPGRKHPDFYCDNETAMKSIVEDAKLSAVD